jgi:hypothetical protein
MDFVYVSLPTCKNRFVVLKINPCGTFTVICEHVQNGGKFELFDVNFPS